MVNYQLRYSNTGSNNTDYTIVKRVPKVQPCFSLCLRPLVVTCQGSDFWKL